MDRSNCICSVIGIGFRFVPSSQEVLLSYLVPIIHGKSLPCNHLIKIALVYGTSPWENFKDNDPFWFQSGSFKTMYVFTRLRRNGKRVSRRAGCGTWTAQLKKKIKDTKTNHDIGCKESFTYKIDKKKMNGHIESDDRWCMNEYTLDDPMIQDYAICKITKRSTNNDISLSNQSKGVFENPREASINQHAYDTLNYNIPMVLNHVDRSIPVGQGVLDNVGDSCGPNHYQLGVVNGSNQLSVDDPMINETDDFQSLIMHYATLSEEDFENLQHKVDDPLFKLDERRK